MPRDIALSLPRRRNPEVRAVASPDDNQGVRSVQLTEHLLSFGTGRGKLFFWDLRTSGFVPTGERENFVCTLARACSNRMLNCCFAGLRAGGFAPLGQREHFGGALCGLALRCCSIPTCTPCLPAACLPSNMALHPYRTHRRAGPV